MKIITILILVFVFLTISRGKEKNILNSNESEGFLIVISHQFSTDEYLYDTHGKPYEILYILEGGLRKRTKIFHLDSFNISDFIKDLQKIGFNAVLDNPTQRYFKGCCLYSDASFFYRNKEEDTDSLFISNIDLDIQNLFSSKNSISLSFSENNYDCIIEIGKVLVDFCKCEYTPVHAEIINYSDSVIVIKKISKIEKPSKQDSLFFYDFFISRLPQD